MLKRMATRVRNLTEVERARLSWVGMRLTLAGLIAAHGWARLLSGGVAPFGEFLDGQGFPLGFLLAGSVTAIEIVGSMLLILGYLVRPLALTFSAIYLAGIVLVHAKAGWFVVGLGRNGSEYSVLLIICLLLLAWQNGKPANPT